MKVDLFASYLFAVHSAVLLRNSFTVLGNTVGD